MTRDLQLRHLMSSAVYIRSGSLYLLNISHSACIAALRSELMVIILLALWTHCILTVIFTWKIAVKLLVEMSNAIPLHLLYFPELLPLDPSDSSVHQLYFSTMSMRFSLYCLSKRKQKDVLSKVLSLIIALAVQSSSPNTFLSLFSCPEPEAFDLEGEVQWLSVDHCSECNNGCRFHCPCKTFQDHSSNFFYILESVELLVQKF